MSLSTLPDIFKENNIRFTRPSKIGGAFSLHLTNINSPERCTTSMSKRQVTTNTGRTQISGRRSSSSQALQKNLINLNSKYQIKSSKISSFQQSIIKKNSQSSFSKDVSALQEIYYKNIMKSKISPQIQTGFPFQTTRTMNNMEINMQQANSMKNRLQLVQKSAIRSVQEIEGNKSNLKQIREQLKFFQIHFEENLSQMNFEFVSIFDQCYKRLSKARRQTNEEIKINKKNLQGLQDQISDAEQVYKLLEDRSNKMREDCIQDEKLLLNKSLTYFNNNSIPIKSNNFMFPSDLTAHKRASSIQGTRKNAANNNHKRVSTTSKGRRLINTKENIKQESQSQQNLFQSIENQKKGEIEAKISVTRNKPQSKIQNAIYNDLNLRFPSKNEIQRQIYGNLASKMSIQNAIYQNLSTKLSLNNIKQQAYNQIKSLQNEQQILDYY